MSTMIALLLVLSALTGCAGESLANVKNALPDAPSREISWQLDYSTYDEAFTGEDGSTLAYCNYTVPQLQAVGEDGAAVTEAAGPEAERALEAADAFNRRFADWRADAPHIREILAQAPAGGGQPVVEQLTCTAYRTGRLVSVSGEYYNYTGGAHPNTMLLSWNFDLDSGTFFETELLEEDGRLKEFVAGELVRQAEEEALKNGLAPGDYFWEDYEDILADWCSYAVSFDEEGMRVGFSPYELACYAAGAQVFRLSYDQLRPYLGQHGRILLGLEEESGGPAAD